MRKFLRWVLGLEEVPSPPQEKDAHPEMPVPPPQPVEYDECPDCNCRWFVPGGPATRLTRVDGEIKLLMDGAVLSCLGCGGRWYPTPGGLKKPHELAMPSSWAMMDLKKKEYKEAERKAAERSKDGLGSPPTPRTPKQEFRMPPKPQRT